MEETRRESRAGSESPLYPRPLLVPAPPDCQPYPQSDDACQQTRGAASGTQHEAQGQRRRAAAPWRRRNRSYAVDPQIRHVQAGACLAGQPEPPLESGSIYHAPGPPVPRLLGEATCKALATAGGRPRRLVMYNLSRNSPLGGSGAPKFNRFCVWLGARWPCCCSRDTQKLGLGIEWHSAAISAILQSPSC
jgi:hypothetical protein